MVQHSVALVVRVLLVLGRTEAWQPSFLQVEDLTQDGGRVSENETAHGRQRAVRENVWVHHKPGVILVALEVCVRRGHSLC